MRRFYAHAGVMPADGGFGIFLDDKPLRTPAKAPLVVPSEALAAAIAAEWAEQGDEIEVEELPLTRLASTALDLVIPRRAEIVADIAKYAGTDLVCYRAAHPPALVARQHQAWQPLIDWATLRFDAALEVTIGIVPIAQSAVTLRAFSAAVDAYAPLELAALHLATTACGSLVVALALIEGRVDVEGAFSASQIDETYEIEQWGEDAEQTRRRTALREDIALAARFVDLLRR